jgi:dipeptidyl aminopeptidase/acylaminoacyl peptidase
MNPDGSGQADRTPAGIVDVRGLAWSPDGRRLAFSALHAQDLDPEIFVMNADGSGLRQVTNNHLPDTQPTWSPDGRFLAFASARTGLFQIYRARAVGGGERRLSPHETTMPAPASRRNAGYRMEPAGLEPATSCMPCKRSPS